MSGQHEAELRIGDSAPGFDLPDVDGERFSLGSFSPDVILVVIFLANHCPNVTQIENELFALTVEYVGRGAAIVGIGSSDAARFPEDSREGMARRVHHAHYPFPYLYDANGMVASTYRVRVTPETFAFDHQRRLQYHGAVRGDGADHSDDEPHLARAIDALVHKRVPPVQRTQPIGCPIEWPVQRGALLDVSRSELSVDDAGRC